MVMVAGRNVKLLISIGDPVAEAALAPVALLVDDEFDATARPRAKPAAATVTTATRITTMIERRATSNDTFRRLVRIAMASQPRFDTPT
jgi:hypothetical protein